MGSGRFFESQDDGICILDIRRELKKLGWKLTRECGRAVQIWQAPKAGPKADADTATGT